MTYDEFINICEEQNLSIQYEYKADEEDKYYLLFAFNNYNKVYECQIDSIHTSTGVADFEANYKDKVLVNYKKYTGDSGDITHSCNDSEWTEFYSITPEGEESVLFQELMIKTSNNHKVKVTIDGEIILNASLLTIYNVIYDDCAVDLDSIHLSYVDGIVSLVLKLNGVRGTTIKVYQQKRSGSGDLTMKGYFLAYIDDKRAG